MCNINDSDITFVTFIYLLKSVKLLNKKYSTFQLFTDQNDELRFEFFFNFIAKILHWCFDTKILKNSEWCSSLWPVNGSFDHFIDRVGESCNLVLKIVSIRPDGAEIGLYFFQEHVQLSILCNVYVNVYVIQLFKMASAEQVGLNKTWELSLYELHRTPQDAITDNTEIAVSPRSLHSELMCPICLDMLKKTMTTKECLHRFCSDCIITALRSGNKVCVWHNTTNLYLQCLRIILAHIFSTRYNVIYLSICVCMYNTKYVCNLPFTFYLFGKQYFRTVLFIYKTNILFIVAWTFYSHWLIY